LEVHEAMGLARFSVIVAHRAAGKTYLAAAVLSDAALRFTGVDGRFFFVSPELKQARDSVWMYLKIMLRDVPSVDFQESMLQVRLPNGAYVCLHGADHPDSLRSRHPHGIVLDEVADMKPGTWGEVVRPMLTSQRAWGLFIGTPRGINEFSQLYYGAFKKKDWFAGLYDVTKTDVLSKEEIEFARQEMTPRQFEQEMMCNFSAGSDRTLIPMELARAAAGRHLRIDQYQHAPRLLGVDPARYGDDRFVITRRQGLAMFPPVVSRGNDTQAGISLVFREAEAWNPHAIFIDPGGNPGVYDGLKKTRWPVFPVDFGSAPQDKRFQNRRAEIWSKMRDWLKDGGCIPDDPAIIADLCSTEFDYHNARGKFALESKEDVKARVKLSPDIADSLATTFSHQIAPPDTKAFYPRPTKVNDWNPLAPEYL
jgi:hypothetical protein